MKLGLLFDHIDNVSKDIDISGICSDSRKAEKGNIFFALSGTEADGRKYIDSAAEKGAAAAVYSGSIEKSRAGMCYIETCDAVGELNRVCNEFYGHPSSHMKIFGVTGTNGKSSITCVIRDIIDKCRSDAGSDLYPCGYIGTIATRFGDVSRNANLTTPDIIELQSTLSEMVGAGMRSAAIEVSSHGLAQRRVEEIDFDIVGFTNLTYDHLDFHKTMEAYFDAKKILFRNMKPSGKAVFNSDDAAYSELCAICACPHVSYGKGADADYMISNIELFDDHASFSLTVSVDSDMNKVSPARYDLTTNLIAEHNIYNLTCAIAMLHQAGLAIEIQRTVLKNLSQIDGRMQKIENPLGISIYADFAHTPDGLEKIFSFAKDILPEGKKIYSVFGSAGKRDKQKRPVFGSIAKKYSDHIFLTEDDPRDESPESIAKEIQGDIPDEFVSIIPDRYSAIEAALRASREGDIVLILGKGIETYIARENGKEFYMGDHIAAAEIAEKICRENKITK